MGSCRNSTFCRFSSACGGLYEASEGSLVSPRDLANVDGGVTCIWIIRVKTGYLPRIEFQDFSFTESQNCSAAYLEAYFISKGNQMQLMPRRCAEEPPPVVVGIDNEVRVRLHVAQRDPHTSFRLRFRSVCEMMVIANRTGGVAQSNSFPNLYVHESECSWNVYAPKGERLALFLTELRFSKTKYCAVSTLTVMAILTKPESRAFLSSEDSLSLRICGGVMKFAYMSVPGADCTSTKLEAPAEIARNIDPKEQSDSAIVWEEIDQIPN
ncbi:CUB domain-containing protein 2 [Ixodes scapularis]